MTYTLRTTAQFEKQIKKLDKYTGYMILQWLKKNVDNSENPRSSGKGLSGNYSGKWRYRIGDYRVICMIEDTELVILALEVGHRRKVYK